MHVSDDMHFDTEILNRMTDWHCLRNLGWELVTSNICIYLCIYVSMYAIKLVLSIV